MSTMNEIINDVLVELRFGSGQDVQVHLQEGIRLNISRLYRTLQRKYTWKDYIYVTDIVTSATTGEPTTDISAVLTKFSNIVALYPEDSDRKLPMGMLSKNPARYRTPTIVPNRSPTTFFTIWPKEERNLVLITKEYQEADFELVDEVPFYRDLLALGAAYQLAVKTGTNDALTVSLKNQFDQLLTTYRMDELEDEYHVGGSNMGIPNDWYENNG